MTITLSSAFQQLVADALEQTSHAMAELRGVGGPSWTVTTPASGLGGSPDSAASVTGRAVQVKLGKAGATAPGQAADVIAWRFVCSAGALEARQQISDGSYTFSVVGPSHPGVYEVERL